MELVRTKCKTCSRSLRPDELLAGLCLNCLEARAENMRGEFVLEFVKDKLHCFECNRHIGDIGGYVHWDRLANSFYLLCIPCSETAIAKDSQYRGTEFGFRRKVQ